MHESKCGQRRKQLQHGELVGRRLLGDLRGRRLPVDHGNDGARIRGQTEPFELAVEVVHAHEGDVGWPERVLDERAVAGTKEELEEQAGNRKQEFLPLRATRARVELVLPLDPAEEIREHFDPADLLTPSPVLARGQAGLQSDGGRVAALRHDHARDRAGVEPARADQDGGGLESRL